MGDSLNDIAKKIKNDKNRVQLIYAFNGTGKTRLSREFKQEVDPKNQQEGVENKKSKVLYYNAYTEDLFIWDNDLEEDENRFISIRSNEFTDLAVSFLKDQGQYLNIVSHFQRYTTKNITPIINDDFSKVTFSAKRGDNDSSDNIKISRGEENNFIWCVFYTFLEELVDALNTSQEDRTTNKFDDLEYIFIDDPVSSLDDSHLIELAVDIAELIKSSKSELKFIITTHNPLFYNVLYNEFSREKKTIRKRLEKLADGTFSIDIQPSDSPFSYHLFLFSELEKVAKTRAIYKYHFSFLRNVLEKTSTFLGYNHWEDLLPVASRDAYYERILNFSNHSKHTGEEMKDLEENVKDDFCAIVEIVKGFGFKSLNNPNVVVENVTV